MLAAVGRRYDIVGQGGSVGALSAVVCARDKMYLITDYPSLYCGLGRWGCRAVVNWYTGHISCGGITIEYMPATNHVRS